jgi:hypothetical protein
MSVRDGPSVAARDEKEDVQHVVAKPDEDQPALLKSKVGLCEDRSGMVSQAEATKIAAALPNVEPRQQERPS